MENDSVMKGRMTCENMKKELKPKHSTCAIVPN